MVVSMSPGQIAFTWMFHGASSTAVTCVIPITAAFEAEYTPQSGQAVLPPWGAGAVGRQPRSRPARRRRRRPRRPRRGAGRCPLRARASPRSRARPGRPAVPWAPPFAIAGRGGAEIRPRPRCRSVHAELPDPGPVDRDGVDLVAVNRRVRDEV